MLTALMMQKMITAFSQSLVPSKCSILNRYFSLRCTREASSKERICSAIFPRALSMMFAIPLPLFLLCAYPHNELLGLLL